MDKKVNIQQIPLSHLKPYINNPRENSKSIKHLEKSIKEYGFTVPITVDEDYVIVTGHSRYFAAKNIGLEEVPVIILEDLSDSQVKQYRIADNAVQEHSTFDFSGAEIRMKDLAADDDFFADVFSQFAPESEVFDQADAEGPYEDEEGDEEEDQDGDDVSDEKECICPYCLHEFNLDEAPSDMGQDSEVTDD